MHIVKCPVPVVGTCGGRSAEPVGLVLVPFSQTTGGSNKDGEKTPTRLGGEKNQNIQHQNILMIENAAIVYKGRVLSFPWDPHTS